MYLQKSENQDIEFKQSWHDEYLKWICAFANTSGGLLYIGVSDNGEICGVTESHKLTEDIPNKIRHTMGLICDIQLLNDNDRKYLKPERWITGAYIKIGFFVNEADILYQDEVHGPLLLQVEKSIELIYSKYMKALISYNDIYRKETFFFPRAAFRELLLNAVIHKDYMSTTPIQIRVYKNKIRLWNDGSLPKEITINNLYKEHISKPCNPNLANVFFK